MRINMFKKGDLIIYSNYGVCIVDEISDNIFDNEKTLLYIMHPINGKSKIMTPVDNKKVRMRAIMPCKEAELHFNALSTDNRLWISEKKKRDQLYTQILRDGEPELLVKMINALIFEDKEKISVGKRISATDRRYLDKAEKLLYPELALALNIEIDIIRERAQAIHQETI
jgi:CarD family transcriptional regulator